jgi:hypothetical protein
VPAAGEDQARARPPLTSMIPPRDLSCRLEGAAPQAHCFECRRNS